MSRIGKQPVPVPSGVDVTIDGQNVSVKGPKGTLELTVAEPITVSRNDVGAIVIARRRVSGIDDRFEPASETISATATPVNDDPHSIPVYGTTNPSQKSFPEH